MITHCHKDHNHALKKITDRIHGQYNFTIRRYIDNGLRTGSGKANQKWMQDRFKPVNRYWSYSFDDITANNSQTGLTNNNIDPIQCTNIDPTITLLSGNFENRLSGWSNSKYKNGNNHSLVRDIH